MSGPEPAVPRPTPQHRQDQAPSRDGRALTVVLTAALDLHGSLVACGALSVLAGAGIASGLTGAAPNEARVVRLFGRYVGTIRADGLRWVGPLARRNRISTRIRNHETSVTKTNDASGSPVETAAVAWQVEDSARATFEVDDCLQFVSAQTEAAGRRIAGRHPYDSYDDGAVPSLRDDAEPITQQWSKEVGERVDAAGVTVVETRFTRLAYAPGIAQAVLQRQQAGAVTAARQEIAEGAVGMVDRALERLPEENVVELDGERKAAMVSNLPVVLCSDRPTSPVVNTGTLCQSPG
ncbi:SPFH domain-containing protein [Nocardiopsis sp. CNT312]|uniref:SPFH domain-containing protein n=1 Tax=Nocardiopsis sp. CNT312 TaxID=1137268 RepID=UPI00048C3229|nr:SPFH domain-containing protein [Nocardiopsis sp. CNT312]